MYLSKHFQILFLWTHSTNVKSFTFCFTFTSSFAHFTAALCFFCSCLKSSCMSFSHGIMGEVAFLNVTLE